MNDLTSDDSFLDSLNWLKNCNLKHIFYYEMENENQYSWLDDYDKVFHFATKSSFFKDKSP